MAICLSNKFQDYGFMKLRNVGAFDNIFDFIEWKLNKFSSEEKNYRNLFENMFLEECNVMAESTDGYRIRKLTYGEVKERVYKRATALKSVMPSGDGGMVGLYLDNSVEWIEIFWAILMLGYSPLLMNKRLPSNVLDKILTENGVEVVISDGKVFNATTVLLGDVGYGDAYSPSEFGKEVVFMTSGTTENVKLCAYTAENFYYQIRNSVDIVRKCPRIAEHYNGELKHLAILPFYHVFGFIAVYMWFGYFSRTFVFMKELNPSLVPVTVKKHGVTHIFAVPLVWERAHSAAMKAIASRGESTLKKVNKGLRLANSGKMGQALTRKAMGEIRENLFGESVKFLISGGSAIKKEALEFFNGIGYHLTCGYGMTEVGITSVEVSSCSKIRNSGSVGAPFRETEYALSEDGELLIRGRNMASRIIVGGEENKTDYDQWFASRDMAELKGGSHYIKGRRDDLIVSSTGENLNPVIIEEELTIHGAEATCLVGVDGVTTLVIQVKGCYSAGSVRSVIAEAKEKLREMKLLGEVGSVVVTPDSLIDKDDFKLSRKKIVGRILSGELTLIDEGNADESVNKALSGLEGEVIGIFSEALRLSKEEIGVNCDFFTDLGGSSLDYFVLSDLIKERYGVDVKSVEGKSATTPKDICDIIVNG